MTVEEAMERLEVLPAYDAGSGPEPCVHTLAEAPNGILVGAHWPLAEAEKFMREHGVEEAGPFAEAMSHGLITKTGERTIFFGTTS